MKAYRIPSPFSPAALNVLGARIGSNIFWSVISEVGGKGLVFAATVYLARTLGAESFGLFSYGLTLTMYFWLAVDLGTNMYGAREIARDRRNRSEILNTILSIRIVSGFAAFGIFVLSAVVFSDSYLHLLVYLGFSLYLIFRALYTEWYLRGLERFKSIAVCNLLAYGALLLMMYLFIKSDRDVARAAVIWSAVYLIGGVLFLSATFYKQPGVAWSPVLSVRKWLHHLRESIHFVISGGLSSLYQGLPIILLGLFSGSYEAGIYSSAHRIIFAAVFVLSVPIMAIYPVLSEFHKNDGASFKMVMKFSSLSMVVISFVFSALIFRYSDELVSVLFGRDFSGAAAALKILSAFFFLRVMREIFVIAVSSAGLQRFYSIASVYSVLFMLLAFYLIHRWLEASPLISASFAMVLTEAGMLLIMLQISRLKIKHHDS